MPEVKAPLSRAAVGLDVSRVSPKVTLVNFIPQDTAILFFDLTPVAALSAGYIYEHGAVAASQAAVNKWAGEAPRMRVAAADFDFVIGQILMQAGLPLTRRPESA